jgi:hypothetical protein
MNAPMHRIASLAGIVVVSLLPTVACKQAPPPGTFATPEEAVATVNAVAGTGDTKRVEEIFGPGSMDMFQSGDPGQDAKAVAKVKALIAQKVAFNEIDANTRVALFGDRAWPFPIPLVLKDGRWRFDTAAGRDELLNRRIGYNELATLASLHEYVDAQREYAAEGRDGKPKAYAQRFLSTEGKHDGLYWPATDGEKESPLGDLVGDASPKASAEPQPFNGYYYRILTSQGKNASGGEENYFDSKGNLTRGFAAVAWPDKHGNSGVMTFLVNQRGIVYQKDLGADTETAAAAIQSFDPDSTWQVTGDSLEQVAEDNGADNGDDSPQ